jgi:hypothetical protein
MGIRMKSALPSRRTQQAGGILIMLMGIGATAWVWYTYETEGYYSVKGSMLFPAAAVLGLGGVLFPGYREERLARGEDISKLHGMQLLTPRWWTILGVALAAGAINFALLK